MAHRGALRLWIKLPWREHHSWLTVLKVPFAIRAFVADKVYRPWPAPGPPLYGYDG